MPEAALPPSHAADEPTATVVAEWRASSVVALVALVAAALFGGNAFALRDRLLGSPTAPPRPAAVSRSAGSPDQPTATSALPADKTVVRSQPWWQGVTTLQGAGSATTPAFTIDGGALQWRLRWTCDSGRLTVRVPARPRPVVDAGCPGADIGYATTKGSVTLTVTATGPWRLQVDQQVDLPLDEQPLPAMTAPGATTVSAGDFYRIDQVGQGMVKVYRLADGTDALRLENFYVSPNTDLEIRLSPLPAPHSTDEFTAAPSASVASLDVTAGSMNFTVPSSVKPSSYRSVVIWCERLHSAYAAASLKP